MELNQDHKSFFSILQYVVSNIASDGWKDVMIMVNEK